MATTAVEQVELVSEDGENLESDWHRLAIGMLVEMVHYGWRPAEPYYAAGNMFIYYSLEQARNRDFRGPDFFLVKNVSAHRRPYWATWLEGDRFPNLIIELMSPSTKQEDLTVKKRIYETTFETPDFFCYDPDTHELLGWRLTDGRYEPLTATDKGRLWCAELGLWLGTWEGEYLGGRGVWLRFFAADGQVLPTLGERAEAAEQRAEVEQHRAGAADQRATAAEQRAAAAEAELARLKAQFSKQP